MTDRTDARVAIVTPDIVGPVKNGGIGTACFHYARTLANAGYKVDVLFSGGVEARSRRHWVAWYARLGISFLSLDDIASNYLPLYGCRWHTERALRIFEFLRLRDYDYIIFQDWHANGFWSTRARQMGAAFRRTRIGVISHSPNQWQKEGMRSFGSHPLDEHSLEWAEKQTIAAADMLVSPSHHMVRWLREHGYPLPPRIAICPYTFEDPVVASRPETVDREHLVFFGRLETRKGLHLLGAALRGLKRSSARLPRKLSLLGKLAEVESVPTADYLRELGEELASVELVVRTDLDYMHAVKYIREANPVVVVASILDNYPLTVIESITNGFCFIASDAGGIPEMVDPAVGFPATAEGLQRKLAELPRLDFRSLSHPYDPVSARSSWLDHVKSVVTEAREVSRTQVLGEAVPPVSVCVPFYRHDRYLERMLSGFFEADLPQLQFVVVDDGTPESERTSFDRLRRELEPLGHVFYTQKNAGPGAARNRAVELARHELLLFFDADNVPYPDLIRRLCEAMARSGADSIAAPYLGVPPMLRRPTAEDAVLQFNSQGGPAALALLDNVVGDVCSLVRRQAFEMVGGFSTERHAWEDWEFFLRLVGSGFRHTVYPEPLFFYTIDESGRNLTAFDYDNRCNLLACLSRISGECLGEIAQVFTTEYMVSQGYKVH